MIEFNPDGSIKMPGKMAAQKEDKERKMKETRCMKIRKEVVSIKAPKTCHLHLTLSDKITDDKFVDNIYSYFLQSSEVPSKLIKLSEKEFRIELGTTFRRCSECTTLIGRFRSILNRNIIEIDGNCSYKQNRQANFCYEDHFD